MNCEVKKAVCQTCRGRSFIKCSKCNGTGGKNSGCKKCQGVGYVPCPECSDD